MVSREDIRWAAEQDFITFVQLIAPEEVIGLWHKELASWWERDGAKSHQLVLIPRDHGKSRWVAYRVCWWLTKQPTLRVLYISATSNLAEKQLSFIKGVLTSDTYRRYWPEYVEEEEGKRSKWTSTEIELDHPERKKENIRDPSVFTGGLTTSLTGLHCDIAVLDDVVVYENAYTNEGRRKVQNQYSLLSSIEGGEAKEWVVGTRYHPLDLYGDLLQMREEVFNDDGDKTDEQPIYETFQRQVESRGDGTGEFLWPRSQRKDGKWFGFDIQILAKKRGKYLNKSQFRAQYYNDPTDPDNVPVGNDKFQYYERKFVTFDAGYCYFKDQRLNVYASVDFAFSTRDKADYTAIVVVGADADGSIYVLDIVRFKTDRISDYFTEIKAAHNKWQFRKIRAEVNVAQKAIVGQLKDMISKEGLALSILEYRPSAGQGSKEERIAAILEHRYDNMSMWHYRGGNIQVLEDELQSRNPPHDDVKDALASAVEISVRPSNRSSKSRKTNQMDWSNKPFRGSN